MIKFFRKIRKNLLSEGKTGKYLKYAFGEIILVVIGILIALQINTWNEQRKNENKIVSLFKEVQTDLLKDLSNVKNAISTYKFIDSLAYLVLNDKLVRDDYKTLRAPYLFQLTTYFEDFQFINNGYENLKLNVNNIPPNHKPAFDSLAVLYEQTQRILVDENNRIGDAVYENIKYLSDNKEWFSSNYSSSKSNDTIIDYFLNDPFYKNRVKEFQLLIDDIYKKYQIDATIIYEHLDVITKSSKSIPNHLKNYIVDSENLKQYIGVYKQKDSTQKNIIEVNQKGFLYNNDQYNLIHEGNDTFSFEDSYNRSVTFQIDDNGEFNGLNIHFYDKKTEYIKSD